MSDDEASSESFFIGRRSIGLEPHLFWLVPMLVGCALLTPHLWHPFHHDEIYTELAFSASFERAFFDYHIPNNHILFSALWRLFRMAVENQLYWRLLPFAAFAVAVVLMALAGRRWSGDVLGGWLCGMVFSTMHPTLAFGAELRGYSQSMTFSALALYALARWRGDPRPRWPILYGIAAFLGVGTVPTNLAAFAAMACGWLALEGFGHARAGAPAGRMARGWLLRTLWLAFAPVLGLAFLAPNWRFLESGVREGSSMAKATFVWHYPWATLGDFLWLPVVAVLAAWFWRNHGHLLYKADGGANAAFRPSGARWPAPAACLFISVLVPMACCLVQRRTPNDYTLSGTLPMIALGLGWLARALLRTGSESPASAAPEAGGAISAARPTELRRDPLCWLTAMLCMILLLQGWRRETDPFPAPLSRHMLSADGRDTAGLSLYFQGFQNDFSAIELVDDLAASCSDKDNPVLFLFAGDPLPVKAYWNWRHSETFPDSLALMVPDDIRGRAKDECLDIWKAHTRRIIVTFGYRMPPAEFFQLFTPYDLGYLHYLNGFKLYDVFEWRPGPLPPNGDPRDVPLAPL